MLKSIRNKYLHSVALTLGNSQSCVFNGKNCKKVLKKKQFKVAYLSTTKLGTSEFCIPRTVDLPAESGCLSVTKEMLVISLKNSKTTATQLSYS